jgi:hypothetical protein
VRLNFIISFSVACLLNIPLAYAACDSPQELSEILPAIHKGIVTAATCGDGGDDGGSIKVRILADGKLVNTLFTRYESSAYVLTLDTTLRFGESRNQGLGVATGAGRDGNGMHYWRLSKNGHSAVDLGDAPGLTSDQFMRGTFSTLVSTTGVYQSYRYFYQVKRGRLTLTKAVGFKVDKVGRNQAVLMDVTLENKFIKVKSVFLSAEKALMCQDGKIACW